MNSSTVRKSSWIFGRKKWRDWGQSSQDVATQSQISKVRSWTWKDCAGTNNKRSSNTRIWWNTGSHGAARSNGTDRLSHDSDFRSIEQTNISFTLKTWEYWIALLGWSFQSSNASLNKYHSERRLHSRNHANADDCGSPVPMDLRNRLKMITDGLLQSKNLIVGTRLAFRFSQSRNRNGWLAGRWENKKKRTLWFFSLTKI